jgi:hypothetical protein
VAEEWHAPVVYGQEAVNGPTGLHKRCPSCEVVINGYHHAGCFVEQCPSCAGKLIVCGHGGR